MTLEDLVFAVLMARGLLMILAAYIGLAIAVYERQFA
jgi:hypothetical protein